MCLEECLNVSTILEGAHESRHVKGSPCFPHKGNVDFHRVSILDCPPNRWFTALYVKEQKYKAISVNRTDTTNSETKGLSVDDNNNSSELKIENDTLRNIFDSLNN